MLAGDIVVAPDDCRFSQLEPKRGTMATGGATFRYAGCRKTEERPSTGSGRTEKSQSGRDKYRSG